jgi:hypothetical protein
MPTNTKKKLQAAPDAANHDPPSPVNSAKSRAEQMFDGNQPEETTQGPTMKVDVVLDLPEHAEQGGDGKTAKDVKDAVDAFLNGFGTDKLPQTQFPVPRSKNNGQAAANFVLWDHVARRANKNLEAATEQAEREGVFGDKDSYVEGETTMTFNSAEYAISVKKNAGSKMIDKLLVEQVLKEVAPNKWQELLDRCFKPRAGAAMRIVSLK